MKSRLAALLLPLAAGVALLAAAGPAAADTVLISGTASDESCGPLHAVGVQTPTRIHVALGPNDVTSALYVQVLTPDGSVAPVVADGPASVISDTYAPGVYAVQVCRNLQYDGATVTYRGTVTTSAAPATPVVVAGVEATLRRVASGSGEIRTPKGIVMFSFKARHGGPASVTIDAKGLHFRDLNVLESHFSFNRLTLNARGATITFVDRGAKNDLVRITAGTYKAVGTVVRGGLRVS
jgi:hypothetical protein